MKRAYAIIERHIRSRRLELVAEHTGGQYLRGHEEGIDPTDMDVPLPSDDDLLDAEKTCNNPAHCYAAAAEQALYRAWRDMPESENCRLSVLDDICVSLIPVRLR